MTTVSIADRVKDTTTTTGTGTVNLGGTGATGYFAFKDVFSTGNQVHYCIAGQGTGEFEVGVGTLTSGTPWTLSRDTVLASSNSGSKVSFSAGTKDVFDTVPASLLTLIQTAVQNSRQVLAGGLLTGGGDLSADRTFTMPATAVIGLLGFGSL